MFANSKSYTRHGQKQERAPLVFAHHTLATLYSMTTIASNVLPRDPRGPHRKCIETDVQGVLGATRLECDHIRQFNQTAFFTVGASYRCFACGPHGDK